MEREYLRGRRKKVGDQTGHQPSIDIFTPANKKLKNP